MQPNRWDTSKWPSSSSLTVTEQGEWVRTRQPEPDEKIRVTCGGCWKPTLAVMGRTVSDGQPGPWRTDPVSTERRSERLKLGRDDFDIPPFRKNEYNVKVRSTRRLGRTLERGTLESKRRRSFQPDGPCPTCGVHLNGVKLDKLHTQANKAIERNADTIGI
jgi:hypothetical protein